MTAKNKNLSTRSRQIIIRFETSFLFYFGSAKISHRSLKDKSRFRLDLANEMTHIVSHIVFEISLNTFFSYEYSEGHLESSQ